jgi:transcriptional regulator with XRE-family HTH domain
VTVDRAFLKKVQEAGWLIEQVSAEAVMVNCPQTGCGMTFNLRPDAKVGPSCRFVPDYTEVPVKSFDDLLDFLIKLRDSLGLNLLETEEIVGFAQGHLAKIESGARLPNFQTVLDLAGAFGIQFVARRGPLPARAIGMIAETRNRPKNRQIDYSKRMPRRLAPDRSD